MPSVILASVLAFVGTNIDDILVLTLLFSRGRGRTRISLGYLLGVALLTGLSALAAFGLRRFSGDWLRLLGLIPILLGVRALLTSVGGVGEIRPSLLGAALITLGNGADNLGVYTALFARCSPAGTALASAVFLLLAALWLLLAARIAALPALRWLIGSRYLVPAVFVLLGIFILLL